MRIHRNIGQGSGLPTRVKQASRRALNRSSGVRRGKDQCEIPLSPRHQEAEKNMCKRESLNQAIRG